MAQSGDVSSETTARDGRGLTTVAARPASDGSLDPASVVLLTAGMACLGTAVPAAAVATRSFPVAIAGALRLAVAVAVLLTVLSVVRRRRGDISLVGTVRALSWRDRLWLVGIGGFGTLGVTVFLLVGMRYSTGAAGAVVLAMTPAVTALGAVAVLGDRMTGRRAWAIALSVLGVVIVNLGGGDGGGGDRVVVGSMLLFGAVVCEAAYTLFAKRLTANIQPFAVAGLTASVALAFFVPAALWQLPGFEWSAATRSGWLAVLWWGAVTSGLGACLWFAGMSRVAASAAAPFMAVMPVSALLSSYVALDESFEPAHVVGLGTVLVGIGLAVRGDVPVHRTRRRADETPAEARRVRGLIRRRSRRRR